jgi:PhnB protein
MAKAKSGVPAGFHTVTPHLIMNNASSALDWYEKALGAEIVSRSPGPDGKIMHAEMRIGNSRIFLNDEMGGGKSLKAVGGSPVSLWIYVDDCDALFNRAVAAGAKVPPGPMGALADQFWGDRTGSLTDPEGYVWTIATRKEDLTPEEINQRAEAFFKEYAAAQK